MHFVCVAAALLAFGCCSVGDAARSRVNSARHWDSLTPNSESSSFTSESKRYHDELQATLTLLKSQLHDETMRLNGILTNLDNTLKSEIHIAKMETNNNMKRHSASIMTYLINQYLILKQEIPNVVNKLLKKIDHIDSTLGTIETVSMDFIKWKNAIRDQLTNQYSDLVKRLEAIDGNTDLKNTDRNSIASQVDDINAMVLEISQGIASLDKRIPGINLNGDNIIKHITSHFESLNLKLNDMTKINGMLSSMSRRVDDLLSRYGSASYPENDNHVPNAGSIPHVPEQTFLYKEEF